MTPRSHRAAWTVLALAWTLVGCAGLRSHHALPSTQAALEPIPAGWTTVTPGLLRWRGEPGLHALRLDLKAPSLLLALSHISEAGSPIDSRPNALAALAAVNASFFDRHFRVRGLTVSEGQAWPEPMSPQDSPLLACTREQRCELQLTPPYHLPQGTYTAVAGTPWLLRQGQARSAEDDASCAAFCASPHPRTALGLSADRRYLFMFLAEGRRAGVPGISLSQTAAWMQHLGAHEAFNLDGGGSSALLIRGRSEMQRPGNESAQRRVANVLLIQRQP